MGLSELNIDNLQSKHDVEGLTTLLKNQNTDTRLKAVNALGMIEDSKALDPLLNMLDDENQDVRAKVLWALGMIKDPKAFDPLLKLLTEENNPKVRGNAAWSLGMIGNEKALEPLIQALEDQDTWVRQNALEGLEKIGSEKAAKPLIRMLSDESEGIRGRAASAIIPLLKKNIELIEGKDVKHISRLILQTSGIHHITKIKVLPILLKDLTPDDIAAMVKTLFITDSQASTAGMNSVLISELARIGKPCIPAMVEAFNNKDNENDIRVRAVKVLGRIDDAEALETLSKAAHDKNLNVQHAALSAFRSIEAKKKTENDDQIVSQEDKSTLKNKSTKKSLISYLLSQGDQVSSDKHAMGEDIELLNQAIEALKKDNKSAEGVQALKKALEINPGLAKAHQLLAMYYMGVQNGELAKKHFEILWSLDKDLAQQMLDSPFGQFFEGGVSFIKM